MTDAIARITQQLATDLNASEEQVRTATALLDDGATVPFIARYRKEATGGLDDGQLRLLDERLGYLRELEDRRASILASIEEQGKLDDSLRADIEAAETKARLEDLYLPYKPKRRTKAQIAREAGLEPLADLLAAHPEQVPEIQAEAYIDADKGIADSKAALDGARAIIVERLAEDASLVGDLREWLWQCGELHARVFEGKETEGAKYRDYFDHAEAVARIPSHRLLALMRARNEGVLSVDLVPILAASTQQRDEDRKAAADLGHQAAIGRILTHADWQDQGRPGDAWLQATARNAWLYKLHVSLSVDLMVRARETAEAEAIRIFGDNLQDLLMTAPAGQKAVMGLDPALRTGVKVAVVDATGKLVATDTLYPHVPRNQWAQSLTRLAQLADQHRVDLIAIGNGTGSRETDRLAAELIRKHPELKLQKLMISEAGASVYSASELAAREFPDLDVSLRGAASIARRLQDPLAELVKIDPKAIGVGQYQHDVNQSQLARALDARVEDCVNAVGVELNTASAPLLARVAGLSGAVAENVVQFREAEGAFRSRRDLLRVPRLGDKTFEQCAGFLRIAQGDNPLDSSAVHPEAYPVVERILASSGRSLADIIGDSSFLKTLRPTDFTDERFGEPTVRDIISELDKPGRDPRPEFKTAVFAEGVEDIKDLQPGMVLEGVVSNVAAFGAFIDLGVHQDGLVHVSAMSKQFIKDPRELVKAGDIITVKVMDVDLPRKRISLSMRLDDTPEDAATPAGKPRQAGSDSTSPGRRQGKGTSKPKGSKPAAPNKTQSPGNNALADAFARAKNR